MATPVAAESWAVQRVKFLTREHIHLVQAGGDVEGVIVLPTHDVSPGQQVALAITWRRSARLQHIPPAVVTRYLYLGRDAAGVTLQQQRWTLWGEDARTLEQSIGISILSDDPICVGWVISLIGRDETAKTDEYRYPMPTEFQLSRLLLGLETVTLQLEPAPAAAVRVVYPQQ
nr:MAG: hypothetical protein DIU57_18555 [Pseudomonadota bacterium]